MKEQHPGVKWFRCIFYPTRKTNRAVRFESGVIPRLRESGGTFFTPWGPRYHYEKRGVKIRAEDKEVRTLKFLADLWLEFQQNGLATDWQWLFLGADTYGARINHLPAEIVGAYFESFGHWVNKILPHASFRLWSDFDDQVQAIRQVAARDLEALVSSDILLKARQTALALKNGGDPRAYVIERLTEAMFIEQEFGPVKISAVHRGKDAEVDLNLPRLYFVPPELQAPWMGGAGR